MQAVLDWLRAGDPVPHWVYLAAFGLLMLEDGIARLPIPENSSFQLLGRAVSFLLSIPPLSLAAALIKSRKDPK